MWKLSHYFQKQELFERPLETWMVFWNEYGHKYKTLYEWIMEIQIKTEKGPIEKFKYL